ncbi:hypothetical protein S7711_07476 [Stachybotrys chartarum IBT 7711]|uniref:mRNA N(6)-methyladenine demethylase n=1 Tax=Stachybotrys chartarum (strain CBS 109288 / IBT 7711) TaxID=1280523 RepID=A0A084AFQ2_STACB|nr:hypothetical protein S7711_07476 [Stachybotrys chartarum IBT 7711]KFA50865.1 hypothetical protein S40293_02498 [Stachybotrys chartarum IBT 40293]
MAVNLGDLDAHEQPTDAMRSEWKSFVRLERDDLVDNHRIDDPRAPQDRNVFNVAGHIPRCQISKAFAELGPEYADVAERDCQILHHPIMPGLLIVPSLLPPAVQITLMDRMVHRDLSSPRHQTNLHLHYHLPYPPGLAEAERSFFSLSPEAPATFVPKDSAVHKPLTAKQVMQRRLHWVTLGGQYDWTNRVYPGEEPPQFPPDLSKFLAVLFPETLSQAAIVNFYSPGDTMMLHRDVSEETNKGLISLSFGCDCLFMISPSGKTDDPAEPSLAGDERRYLTIRLRSGDALYMTGQSRYAWHGVPKIVKGSCPDYLEDWPAQGDQFAEWRGWMQSKRVNLNVRQMKD